MLTYSASCAAPPPVAWSLIARPARWHEWAPQLRGAWGLGEPEVRAGARGAARLLWAVPVPARILSVEAGRSWRWQVGPVHFDHRVEPAPGGGSRVGVDMSAPGPLEAVLAATYGPVIAVLVRRLAAVAARDAGRA
jgi:hypothetical protein